MEIVEGKKCCLVEMRMIDADTECCSKIMVIGSRMSSFVEKGEKKKKTIFPPAHLFSYPLFVTFRWPRLLSGVSILSWIERLPIAHHHHHSLVSLFLYLTAVWCDVAFEPMENGGGKKKKKRTNERKKKNNTREGGRQCFSFVDTTIVEWTWKPDSICQVELILNQFEHWFATEWMMDRLPSQPWIPERARVMRFYSCRFDSTRRKLESLIGRARLRRIWRDGKKDRRIGARKDHRIRFYYRRDYTIGYERREGRG